MNTHDNLKADIIIYSVTYFNVSKIYPNNTALILMTAHYQLSNKRFFKCITKNKNGETKTSISTFKSAYQNVGPCLMHTFIASCPTISNPTSIYVTASHKSDIIKLPLRYANAERLPIVSCVSSLYFAERWQIIAINIEWYSYFGVNRQGYYLISAMEGIYELLKAYEKLKMIDIHHWNIPDIPELNSRQELDSRDIAGSLNDCYINYREAADFIIVHDVDDLIYIKQGAPFYPAFKQHWQEFPLTKTLNLTARTVEMEAENGYEKFSMLNTFQTMNVLPERIYGKSIYNTSLIESVWIHWPTEFDKRLKSMTLDEKDAVLIHARTFKFGKYNQTKIGKIVSRNF
uniref:Glycosyltransferase family 92 protein n=1 Tax=Panagrolaimus davidi TaxID=227884 RepID=A0A914PMH5_9BILA